MAVRGEEVAGSIDAHIRESIEKMVEEIRSSVEDVRVAVDSQLKAALQSVQADVKSISFLPHIKKSIAELEETFAAAHPVAAAPSGAGAAKVKEAVQNIERHRSQVDVLNALLEQAVQFGSRAALLILRGETFSGWKGLGFSAHGGNDEMVKRFNAAPGLLAELDTVLRKEKVVAWDGVNLSSRLGVTPSTKALLVPMVIKDKVAAAVYVDAVADDTARFDSDAIELLVFMTGLLVDTLAIRKKIPSPSLTADDSASRAAPAKAPAPAPAAPAAPRPVAPPPPPKPPPPEQAIPRYTDAGTVAINTAQLRQMMAAPSPAPTFNVPATDEFGGGPAGTAKIPAMDSKPAATPAAAPAPAPATDEARPSTQYIPPSSVARGPGSGPQSDDAKKHDEARRFARLLVSEIKLYNETKVDQGRKNNDLYDRLKEDIDRSRQMYDERIGDDVRKVSNYFYDELVRILADGKADSLGL